MGCACSSWGCNMQQKCCVPLVTSLFLPHWWVVVLILSVFHCTHSNFSKHKNPYENIAREILADLINNKPCPNGDWALDYGDASFYGQSLLIWQGLEEGNITLIERGLLTTSFVLSLVEQSKSDFSVFVEKSDDLLMGTFGLLETWERFDKITALNPNANLPKQKEIKEAIDFIVDTANNFIASQGFYLSLPLEIYAIQTYGNTVVTGMFGLLNIEYARIFTDNPSASDKLEIAKKIANEIYIRAWDSNLNGFRYKLDDSALYLYPNVIMMLFYGRLYQLTGTKEYLERSIALFDTISMLKDPKGCFHSPYSAKKMGAKTEDYVTLSSQNYTMLAILNLFQNTGDPKYLHTIEEVLSFIVTHLYDGKGCLLHHWMDGEVAKPTHLEYYCTGCNFQFLYVLRSYWRVLENE